MHKNSYKLQFLFFNRQTLYCRVLIMPTTPSREQIPEPFVTSFLHALLLMISSQCNSLLLCIQFNHLWENILFYNNSIWQWRCECTICFAPYPCYEITMTTFQLTKMYMIDRLVSFERVSITNSHLVVSNFSKSFFRQIISQKQNINSHLVSNFRYVSNKRQKICSKTKLKSHLDVSNFSKSLRVSAKSCAQNIFCDLKLRQLFRKPKCQRLIVISCIRSITIFYWSWVLYHLTNSDISNSLQWQLIFVLHTYRLVYKNRMYTNCSN